MKIIKKKLKKEINGIELKKSYGQHFLQDQNIIDKMIKYSSIENSSSVFEIGCGSGILTKAILKKDIKRFWVFEIDKEWANYVKDKYSNDKMQIINSNILDFDFTKFKNHEPWILIANLPYQITFSLLYKLAEYRSILKEAIIMIQEEVAQKIVKSSGRGYGFNSLYLQHFFDFKILDKINPEVFYPIPKVYSRILYLKPKEKLDIITDEPNFWIFIKRCFEQPRRNLKNNLKSYQYNLQNVTKNLLNLRAQQLNKAELISLWQSINKNMP